MPSDAVLVMRRAVSNYNITRVEEVVYEEHQEKKIERIMVVCNWRVGVLCETSASSRIVLVSTVKKTVGTA